MAKSHRSFPYVHENSGHGGSQGVNSGYREGEGAAKKRRNIAHTRRFAIGGPQKREGLGPDPQDPPRPGAAPEFSVYEERPARENMKRH